MDPLAQKKIQVFFQSSTITLIMIGIMGGIGYLLDRALHTGHLLLIIGIVISYPLTQLYLYRKFKPPKNPKISKL
ncbi:MAG: hypothetical protein UT55_C0011G0010 [Candidatus Peregrinibacteria bacterium GW2011_GWE2_39_6]|nr:MAG: hypothetical protein UT36_C0004G0039 [Candidatus Peregrinibacteria bacterium GW2011_GWF2_39_17]KKR26305.1 MAG: hypothetical protein UT55_C0011G0010 [Candidatus Peregrinibacteria bacterium GW2011_GWE2_39_6]HCW32675.1 hypothetical protein [Candidatus Peregrinibacteria bacterium]